MTTQIQQNLEKLYEEDYVLWIDETIAQLQKRDVDNLDWNHLIEEMEALGSEQRHKVNSYLLQLLIHLLLYQYWESEKDRCRKGWEDEIDNFRVQLEFLWESKILYNYFLTRIDNVYLKARRRAIKKTQLSPDVFPEQCPFSIEQLIKAEFFPD